VYNTVVNKYWLLYIKLCNLYGYKKFISKCVGIIILTSQRLNFSRVFGVGKVKFYFIEAHITR